jgi:uncharacterized protein YecT (DUF1311 family)
MKSVRPLCTPILAVLISSLVLVPNLRAVEEACQEAVSTAEMLNCVNGQYREADAELNRVYRQLTAQLSEQRREQLKVAQQAWLSFRDKNAAFAAGVVEGGTMAALVEVTELTTMTRFRTEQLRSHLK